MEQPALPYMPEPPARPDPEPMWIEARIEVRLNVRVNVTAAVLHAREHQQHWINSETDQPFDYDDLTEEWLHKNAYGPNERGAVFIWNQVSDALEVDCYMPNLIKEVPFGDSVEIDFTWTPELQAELDQKLGAA